jgi:hypothetical protein
MVVCLEFVQILQRKSPNRKFPCSYRRPFDSEEQNTTVIPATEHINIQDQFRNTRQILGFKYVAKFIKIHFTVHFGQKLFSNYIKIVLRIF